MLFRTESLCSAIIKHFNNSLNQSDLQNKPKVADSLLFQALFPWAQVLPLKITQWFQSRVPQLIHAMFTQTLEFSLGHLSHGQWCKIVLKQKLNLLFILTLVFLAIHLLGDVNGPDYHLSEGQGESHTYVDCCRSLPPC